ncbi:Rpn family recombination-promoting nuclease/putative transposase [Providencia rettgeri]|uniref:Rpn family recombination-promoting nuclease/putative transposase n=1 Tax=Providencia rettgeri TaxID=587 RepID=UPI002361C9E7|nr:Rpn family recombination-promoting nuclease/putative transposase [Providencia rettgeri]
MVKQRNSIPHDAAFKGFMSKVDNARDFFDIHLPTNIKQLCHFDTLAITNTSFIDKQLRSRFSDVLYTVETQQGDGYIYMLVEHQSSPDKLMGWRLMHYAFLAMNQHLQQGNKDLPLVVPVLFYHGKVSPYPYAQPWTHCFHWPDVASDLYSKTFPIVDITVIDDNELVNHRKVAVMELAMKHKDLRDEFQRVVPLLAQALHQHYNNDDDIITILNYLFITVDSIHFEYIVQQLSEATEKHQGVIMNIALRLQEKGRKEGIEEGIEKGIEKGRKEAYEQQLTTAQYLLKSGIDLQLVINSTGLSREDLMSLQ